MPTVTVTDAPSKGRFELSVDGLIASVADYVDHDGVRTFPHTGTLAEFEGRGYGTRLVTEALRVTIAEGMRVSPACPFVRHIVGQNPEFLAAVV